MTYEATLLYNEPLLRKAVFGFWRRTVGYGFFIAILIVAGSLAILAANGDATWVVGAIATFWVMAVLFAVAIYVTHYRTTIRKFRDMGKPLATFRADESSITMSSDLGTTTVPWSSIKEVWQFPEFWLLLFSKAQFSTLPTSCLSPELQAFIVRQVEATGGKVG